MSQQDANKIDFMFGNVDKQGRLESEDQDLRELLNQQETAEYLNKAISASVQVLTDGEKGDQQGEVVEPSADAVDYTDITELAEDIAPKPTALKPTFFTPVPLLPSTPSKPKEAVQPLKFTGRLKFSEVFASHITGAPPVYRAKKLVVAKDEGYQLGKNDVDFFQIPMPSRFQERSIAKDEEEEKIDKEDKTSIKVASAPISTNDALMSSVVLEHWEENIIWDEEDVEKKMKKMTKKPENLRMYRNEHLDDDEWTLSINWGDNEPRKQEFHLDDPTLLILQEEVDHIKAFNPEKASLSNYKKGPDGKVIDRFNISDDWKYETGKGNISIKQTHGPVKLMHSMPAVKLHPQYFKPILPVREMRYHHRPTIKFPIAEQISFTKVKAIKRKKLREIDPADLMRTPKDLSLKDSSKFVLAEYSEEYPIVMQNIGMATLINNYYRKRDEKDTYVPKLDFGGNVILEGIDVSPFFGFGDVKPGQTMQAFYNNLFRAPIFPQKVNKTDFLIIRQTYKGAVKYFVRDIPALFAVGQCYPAQEVHRPQARKVTQALKARLQVFGYRLMRSDPYRRLSYSKLRAHFHMYTDTQIRQKLKEFACYYKKGENTGWWKLKPGMLLPDEEGIRKICTPEFVCLQHSTLVGAQRLKDAGYGVEDFKELEGDDDNESHLDLEVQLAPWTTTRNFLNAAQGKGMIQLFGPGDPTGCGEGFSFIRASMKEMFFPQGETEEARNAFTESRTKQTYHKYSIQEQQKMYRNEIERIWNNQVQSLSRTSGERAEPEKDQRKLEQLAAEKAEEQSRQDALGGTGNGMNSPAGSPPAQFATPSVHEGMMYVNEDQESEEDAEAEAEAQSSVHGSTLAGKNKMLVINRLVKNENGDQVWKSEVITDSRVLNAYLRHRKLIDAAPTALSMYPNEVNNAARRKRRTYAHMIKLQIKQGKLPPIKAEEDLSESELPDETIKRAALPVSLKYAAPQPTKSGTDLLDMASSIEPKYKKRTFENMDAPEPAPVKVYTGLSQEEEHAKIFEKIVDSLIAIPSYAPFITPNPTLPICLAEIKEKVQAHNNYFTKDFYVDLNRIMDAVRRVHGIQAPIAIACHDMIMKGYTFVHLDEARINELEADMRANNPITDNADANAEMNVD